MDRTEAIQIMKMCKPLAERFNRTNFNLPIGEYEGTVMLKLVEVMESPYWNDLWVRNAAGLRAADVAILKRRLLFHFWRAGRL